MNVNLIFGGYSTASGVEVYTHVRALLVYSEETIV